MLEVLSENETANLIVELFKSDPNTDRQFVGAMEFHSGRHPQRGRITVIKENSGGQGTVFPTPRPVLTLVKTDSLTG